MAIIKKIKKEVIKTTLILKFEIYIIYYDYSVPQFYYCSPTSRLLTSMILRQQQ